MGLRSLGWNLVTNAATFTGNKETISGARRQSTKQTHQIATAEDFEDFECDCLICHRKQATGGKANG